MVVQEPEKPRWLYRFDNFKRAFALLREAVEAARARPLSQLEKEGLIQRFEYSWELAWKVMKDYLEAAGIVLDTVTPAAVIRAALAAKMIADGEAWMRALDARNKMAHTYSFKTFEEILVAVDATYFTLLDELHLFLLEQTTLGRHG